MDNLRDGPKNQTVATSYSPWLVIFADLLSLLLTFFVLLFSMNAVHEEKWGKLVESVHDVFPGAEVKIEEPKKDALRAGEAVPKQALDLGYLRSVLERQMAKADIPITYQITRSNDGVVISFPAKPLFNGKTSRLSEEAQRIVTQLVRAITPIRNKALIAVHTDLSREIDRYYADDWELSLGRGQVLADLFYSSGYHSDLSIVGYGSSRFNQLNHELDLTVRYALADRVDIILLKEQRNKEPYDIF